MPIVRLRTDAPRDLPVAEVPHVESADERIVRTHATGVFRFVRSLGASREVADDVTQEAFVAAWRKNKQHLPAPALAVFLRRAAKLAWLHHRRGERRAEAAIAAFAEATWVGECGDDGGRMVDAARACTQMLRGRAQRGVQLAYGEGAGREAIASALGMTSNGVKTLLARTRQWLATCIERHLRGNAS